MTSAQYLDLFGSAFEPLGQLFLAVLAVVIGVRFVELIIQTIGRSFRG